MCVHTYVRTHTTRTHTNISISISISISIYHFNFKNKANKSFDDSGESSMHSNGFAIDANIRVRLTQLKSKKKYRIFHSPSLPSSPPPPPSHKDSFAFGGQEGRWLIKTRLDSLALGGILCDPGFGHGSSLKDSLRFCSDSKTLFETVVLFEVFVRLGWFELTFEDSFWILLRIHWHWFWSTQGLLNLPRSLSRLIKANLSHDSFRTLSEISKYRFVLDWANK